MLLMTPYGQNENEMSPQELYREQLELKANAVYHLITDDNLTPIMEALRPLTAGEREFVQKYVAELDAVDRPPDAVLDKGAIVQAAIDELQPPTSRTVKIVLALLGVTAVGLTVYLVTR